MSLIGVEIKVGDKLRYLGGDPANKGELIRGLVYDVVDIDGGDIIIIDIVDNGIWVIGGAYKNVDCFELFKEEEYDKSTLDLIANLAQEVAKLKRELGELRGDVQAQAYADKERIDDLAGNVEMLIDDMVMIDERTSDAGESEPRIKRKEVYEYE